MALLKCVVLDAPEPLQKVHPIKWLFIPLHISDQFKVLKALIFHKIIVENEVTYNPR